MNEKEERIKNALLELQKNAGKMLEISFPNSEFERVRTQQSITQAQRQDNGVLLSLVEPKNGSDLDDWANAITKAEELLDQFEKEKAYECNHPNFFKAILSSLNWKRLISKSE